MPRLPFLKKDITRFWSRVLKTDNCWLWMGARGGKGNKYGYFMLRGNKQWSAHRFAYTVAHGKIPKGMLVCHRCNKGLCVNPDHLYLGTNKQNLADAYRDGLTVRGEQSPQAKLTTAQVLEIRRLFDEGVTSKKAIADMHGVSDSTIRRIGSRRGWRHV